MTWSSFNKLILIYSLGSAAGSGFLVLCISFVSQCWIGDESEEATQITSWVSSDIFLYF